MRLVIFSAALAMALLFGFVKVAIQPNALVQDWQPSSADLVHPPSAVGSVSFIASPQDARH